VSAVLHVGLLINPLAGLGGSLGLKGSDGQALRRRLADLSEQQRERAAGRVRRVLDGLAAQAGEHGHSRASGNAAKCSPDGAGKAGHSRASGNPVKLRFSTWGGAMGADLLAGYDFPVTLAGSPCDELTDAGDTRKAAHALLEQGVDIIVFAGGDGTARDILDAVGQRCPVLGIPAGVKMHSGVFAVSPEAAAELLLLLARGGLVDLRTAEVRDIDEEAFRRDIVRSRFYGELLVPAQGQFLQHTKLGGREDPDLAAADIAAWVVENMEPERLYLVGPGSTTAAIMQELGLPNTLLGVDVVRDGQVLVADADEEALLAALAAHGGEANILVTAIGGQGHVFGRGNQQFSPAVIRAVGRDKVVIVAAKSKLAALQGRPLLVDTNDPLLDASLRGYRAVLTGYDDRVLYRVDTGVAPAGTSPMGA